MKYITAALLLVAGTSLNEVQALKQKTFLVNGESVTMWLEDKPVTSPVMTQLKDD